MKIQELKDSLKISEKGLVSIQADSLDAAFRAQVLIPFYPSKSIQISNAHPGEPPSGSKVVIAGKASCPLLPGDELREVLGTFELNKGELTATLRYTLPLNWKFSHSFPDLPFSDSFTDPPLDTQGQKSVLDDFLLSDSYFYLTSRPHKHEEINLQLQSGLNVVGRWQPDGVLGLFKDLLAWGNQQPALLLLQGRIVLSSVEGLPSLEPDQFPWESTPPTPGIYLQASLGFELNFPSKAPIKFTNLRLQTYTPTSWRQLYTTPSCEPTMAYLGDIVIPTVSAESLATVAVKIWPDSDDELVLACKFNRITLENLSAALANIVGITDLLSVIPADIKNLIGGLGPRGASIHIVRTDGKFRVACIEFTIGIEKKPDSKPWPFDWFNVQFESLRIAVVKSFNEGQPSTFATIKGRTSVFGLAVSVTAELPGLLISVEQIEDKKVDLGRCLEGLGLKALPPPPTFDIKRISLVIQKVQSYVFSFSMAIDPEKSWKIEGKDLPHVRLSLSNWGWEFEAGTDEGQPGVPVAALIYKLVQEGGSLGKSFADITPPPALNAFTVDHLSLSYESTSGRFALVCDGGFRQDSVGDGPGLRARVSIDKNSQRGSTTFLVAVAAQKLTLGELIRRVSPDDLASYVPKDFNLELRDALFAFVTSKKSKCLFALDFGVDIDLAATISRLDFLKSAGLTLGKVGFEDLQILIANDSFKSSDIDELNALLPRDFRPIPLPAVQPEKDEALHQGVNFSGKLLLPGGEMPLQVPTELAEKPAAEGTPQALAQKSDAPATKWFDIQKSLGPLYLGRVGLQYRPQDKTINFLLDSSIELLGLRLALMGLRVGLDIAHLDKGPKFELDGLEISFQRGPISIGGGLLLLPDGAFVGSVLIKSELFSLFGLGAYKSLPISGTESRPSLFIFAVLHKDLGGPPCFHVTGLAFGFGYNQKLALPGIVGVAECGLVKSAMQPVPKDLLGTALTISQQVSTPAVGEYWLAAGVKFTSFEMIESFALLSVSFGTETVISIMGLSRITVPAKAPAEVTPVAYAELAFLVSFRPQSGVLMAEARLTPNSYLFTKDCKLTGGFAFYAWFKDLEIKGKEPGDKIRVAAGDFVVSLGGYHPRFQPPRHYPAVPRLGLAWKVSENLQIAGEVYFALTPTCIMLGGRLSSLYQQNGIRAWFVAYADFLIAWQPLHYDAQIGVRIGVAYVGTLCGISVNFGIELSANVHLWGPPLAGKAEIQCTFISFTIYFGSEEKTSDKRLDWAGFAKSFLPPGNDSLTVSAVGGLVKEEAGGQDGTCLVVNPYELKLLVKSAVPAQSIHFSSPVTVEDKAGIRRGEKAIAGTAVGIRPMGVTAIQESCLSITVSILDSAKPTPLPDMHVSPLFQNVPGALWGTQPFDSRKLPDSNADLTSALTGIQLRPPAVADSKDIYTILDFDKQINERGQKKAPEEWHYRYAITGQAYDPNRVIEDIHKPKSERYTVVQSLAAQGWLQQKLDKNTLNSAYARMQFRDSPVECFVGQIPHIPEESPAGMVRGAR